MRLEDTIDKETYDRKYLDLSSQIEQLQKECESLQDAAETESTMRKRVATFRQTLEQNEVLDTFDRHIFESIVEKVIVGGYDSDGNKDPYMIVFVYKTGFKNSVDGKNFKPLRKNSKENHSPAVLCSHASNEAESMCSDSSDDTRRVRSIDVKRWTEMRFELNEFHRNVPDTELIEDLQRVSNQLKQDTVTIDDYNEFGEFHATTLTRRFGSWFNCLAKASLKPSRSKIGITDEELFEEIENVWVKLGKQPKYSEMRDISKYSIGTYEKRFGGWQKALEKFVEYISAEENEYEPAPIEVLEPSNCQRTTSNNTIELVPTSKHRTPRKINLRLRFKVLARDNYKCCACGASPAKDPSVELEVDHIIPWDKGGETLIENLQTLCHDCNLGKSNLMLD